VKKIDGSIFKTISSLAEFHGVAKDHTTSLHEMHQTQTQASLERNKWIPKILGKSK
jgi:hypothetical protein